MNVKSIIIIITIFFKENVIYCEFFPSIASHPGFEIMYNTKNGWVQHNYTLKNQTNGSEVLELCKKLYPKNNIKLVMKMFETELITNWSHKAINSNKTTNSSFDIHPFRCLDDSYQKIRLSVSRKCRIYFESDKSCQSFDHWKSISMKNCTSKLSYLDNMQQIYTSNSCQDVPMHFNQNEYICCRADIDYYEKLLNNYMKNGHKERSSFSKLRHALSLVYKVKLNECNLRLNEKMESLILNSKHDRSYYESGLKILKKNFKSLYVNISEWYSNQFLKIEQTHIKRIIEKIKYQCSNLNEKTQVPNKCIKLMNSITDQLYHHKRISSVNSSYVYEVNNFLIKEFEILKKNYFLGLNKSIAIDLSEKLDKAVEYLTPKNYSLTIYDIFEKEFKKCISKHQNSIKFNPDVKHSHNTPIISIVVTTVILLCLIVLTFIATLVIKCCGQPFRRSSPNYVMSVVFNANQNQGPMHRLDQQISSNANKQDVKLNLYENPIFNAKSVGKPIEKQSLIENMES